MSVLPYRVHAQQYVHIRAIGFVAEATFLYGRSGDLRYVVFLMPAPFVFLFIAQIEIYDFNMENQYFIQCSSILIFFYFTHKSNALNEYNIFFKEITRTHAADAFIKCQSAAAAQSK